MKKLLALVLALTLVLSLAGCHGSLAEQTEQTPQEQLHPAFAVPDSFDTGKHYEITFWAKNDTNLTQVAIYKQAIADFEALYPNITVNLRLYTDYGKIYNDVVASYSAFNGCQDRERHT